MAIYDDYGPAAVITGAGRGIGLGSVDHLAARGFELLLTDIDASLLESVADQLRTAHGSSVTTLALDLREPGAVSELGDSARGVVIGLAVCNHLLPGEQGTFLDVDFDDQRDAISANVCSYAHFAHLFGRQLRDRGGGGLIAMSSMTGLIGSPFVASDGASNANVLGLLGVAADELRNSGIDVLVLVPGAVNTETFRAAPQGSSMFWPTQVDDFVADAIGAWKKPVHNNGRVDAVTPTVLSGLLAWRVGLRPMGRNLESMLVDEDAP